MSDIMRPIPFNKLLDWVVNEREQHKTVFGIPEAKFYRKAGENYITLFGEKIDTSIGPAAGPHTQLAQNIVASYLTGSRFFELKTVQILDKLEFPKPCIKAEDEGYNTEWSTELAITAAYEEYVKAWLILHVLQKEVFDQDERRFVFNMSVGYDLEGIKSEKVDAFIEGLKDASKTGFFQECKQELLNRVSVFKNVDKGYIEGISPKLCSSITLSTLHGCPPKEIEAISRYLLGVKGLHTFVKMNPTLLGYKFVRETFDKMGYGYIVLKEESFTHDLQYSDGVAMLRRLRSFAKEQGKEFGVKLSNTLPVKITKAELPGDEMYMSGRALYPLTINLALKLAEEFKGDLLISYSGGADFFNLKRIFSTGIRPITLATTLLKPGGYLRFQQLATDLEATLDNAEAGRIDLERLTALAENAVSDADFLKEKRSVGNRKIERKLTLTDCFVAPCSVGCPIGQDVPEYIALVNAGKYEEAFAAVIRKNPLPFITGTICNHRCVTKCTRLDYDESVQIRSLKLVAAEKGYDSYVQKMSRSEGTSEAKVAIIGAGPSGLAAGYFLAKAGLDVTIFEKREQAGGTVRYVIPEFRISREEIAKDIEFVQKAGVKFKFGADPDFSINKLKRQGFTYIYLAIGAGKSNVLPIEGAEQVQGAIAFLEEYNRNPDISLGKTVAVIGGGNSAMDAARAALRVKGVSKVYVVYRRTREYMPADREELELAMEEGVNFLELLAPVAFQKGSLKCQKMELGAPDSSGRRSPVATGEVVSLEVDSVLAATGEQVDYELLTSNGVLLDWQGKIAANPQTLETSVENVYIGGDVLYGPSTVVEGISHAAKACAAILAKESVAKGQAEVGAVAAGRLAAMAERKGVLAPAQLDEGEANRCLECNTVCNVCTEVCPNRANLVLEVSAPGLNNSNQILHLDGMCNECGNCATFCPNSGAPYKDKLTLFWSEEDFQNSSNPGFLLVAIGEEPVFKARLEENSGEIKLGAHGLLEGNIDEKVAAMIWAAYSDYSFLF